MREHCRDRYFCTVQHYNDSIKKANRCICVKGQGESTKWQIYIQWHAYWFRWITESLVILPFSFIRNHFFSKDYWMAMIAMINAERNDMLISFLVEKYCSFRLKWTFKTIESIGRNWQSLEHLSARSPSLPKGYHSTLEKGMKSKH